ncbi:MAG: hypothetical protein WA700_13540 [Acidobacteriaceae bacterium]
MTQPQESAENEFLNDPFLDATTNLDLSGMSAETVTAMNKKFNRVEKKRDDGFGLNPEIIRDPREEYRALLADPDVRAELAQRDPTFAKRYETEEIERVVAEFRRKNPSYLMTDHNADTVIQSLAKSETGTDWLSNDAAAALLWRSGKWTVDRLTAEFRKCLQAGLLDVPRGAAKILSETEELRVIARLRTGDIPGAILLFVELSFAGKLPAYRSAEKFLAEQPELASKAALFVWANNQPSLNIEEFEQFQNEKLSGVRLLTYDMIDRAWNGWQTGQLLDNLYPNANGSNPQPTESENLDDLSDQELDRRLLQARKDRARR